MEIPVVNSSKGWSSRKFQGEWAETLQKFLSKQQDEVPEGWLTGDQALRKMGYAGACSGQRNKLLNRMVTEKFLDKKDFRIFDGSGRRISKIAHFKIRIK